jgi:voltage-gated potassium channel
VHDLATTLIGAATLVAFTIVVHAGGSGVLVVLLRRLFLARDGSIGARAVVLATIVTALVLLLLHVVEIMAWALAWLLLDQSGRLDSFESALYFSFVTFTTLGYGDIVLGPGEGRLLSGIEALNGILLVGWSTALLFTVVQRAWLSPDPGS